MEFNRVIHVNLLSKIMVACYSQQTTCSKKMSEKATLQNSPGCFIPCYRNTHKKKQLRRSNETLIIGGRGGVEKSLINLLSFSVPSQMLILLSRHAPDVLLDNLMYSMVRTRPESLLFGLNGAKFSLQVVFVILGLVAGESSTKFCSLMFTDFPHCFVI